MNLGRFSELATTNKIYVNVLKLHEIKQEILLDYTGDFEIIGSLLFSEIGQRKTNFNYRKVDDFETCFNYIDVDYDSEDVIFSGWLFKLNTFQFYKVNRPHSKR